MGRRTLLVTPRGADRFDCRYAHWGAGTDPHAQSRRLGRGWSAADVLEEIDAAYDRVLVRDGASRQYCVCWLDPTLSDRDDVALARTDDPAALRARWTEAKSLAVEAVADGLAPRTARMGLLLGLAGRADALYRGDDASFLRDGR